MQLWWWYGNCNADHDDNCKGGVGGGGGCGGGGGGGDGLQVVRHYLSGQHKSTINFVNLLVAINYPIATPLVAVSINISIHGAIINIAVGVSISATFVSISCKIIWTNLLANTFEWETFKHYATQTKTHFMNLFLFIVKLHNHLRQLMSTSRWLTTANYSLRVPVFKTFIYQYIHVKRKDLYQ